MPSELAAEAMRLGFGVCRRRRRGVGDTTALVIGLGGSLLTLMQAPTTVPDFVRWLVVVMQKDETLLEVRRRPSGEVVMTVGPGMDPDTAIEVLEKALRNHDG